MAQKREPRVDRYVSIFYINELINWCVPDSAVNPPQFYNSLEEINETCRAYEYREVIGRSKASIEPQPAVPPQAAQ